MVRDCELERFVWKELKSLANTNSHRPIIPPVGGGREAEKAGFFLVLPAFAPYQGQEYETNWSRPPVHTHARASGRASTVSGPTGRTQARDQYSPPSWSSESRGRAKRVITRDCSFMGW